MTIVPPFHVCFEQTIGLSHRVPGLAQEVLGATGMSPRQFLVFVRIEHCTVVT